MNETKFYLKQGERPCARCGFPVHLDNLHPDSLPIPEDDTPWEIVHGDGDVCGEDSRGWVIWLA
jgi:hypothetical protein